MIRPRRSSSSIASNNDIGVLPPHGKMVVFFLSVRVYSADSVCLFSLLQPGRVATLVEERDVSISLLLALSFPPREPVCCALVSQPWTRGEGETRVSYGRENGHREVEERRHFGAVNGNRASVRVRVR